MKKVILLIALLWGGALCAQNPFEKEILQSKYAIDSIVMSERALFRTKNNVIDSLLKEKKIDRVTHSKLYGELSATRDRNIKLKTYAEGQRLAELIRQKAPTINIDSIAAVPTDTFAVKHLSQEMLQKMSTLDTVTHKPKAEKASEDDKDSAKISVYGAMGFYIPSDNKPYSFLGSRTIEFGIYNTIYLQKNNEHLRLRYGLSWVHHKLRMKDNQYYVLNGGKPTLTPFPSETSKLLLRTQYLMLPLDLYWDSEPKTANKKGFHFSKERFFRGSIGLYAGYLLDSNQKMLYKANDIRYRSVMRTDLNINPWIYGLSASVGYNKIYSFYFRYQLSPLFKSGNDGAFTVGIQILK